MLREPLHVTAVTALSLTLSPTLTPARLNDRFQLGLADRLTRSLPVPLAGLSAVRVVALACGQQHTVCVGEEGAAYSWGLGSFGQLGHGR